MLLMDSINVTVADQIFVCEVAATPEQRTQGLMFRETLDTNAGMLFDFQQESIASMWMKNTLIPLDVIWLDAKKRVLDIKTLQPCTQEPCQSFLSNNPTRWVLEVNAHTFPGKVGDLVEFDL